MRQHQLHGEQLIRTVETCIHPVQHPIALTPGAPWVPEKAAVFLILLGCVLACGEEKEEDRVRLNERAFLRVLWGWGACQTRLLSTGGGQGPDASGSCRATGTLGPLAASLVVLSCQGRAAQCDILCPLAGGPGDHGLP